MTKKQPDKSNNEKINILCQAIAKSRPPDSRSSVANVATVLIAMEAGLPVVAVKRIPTRAKTYEIGDELVVPEDWANRERMATTGFFATTERYAETAEHGELSRFYRLEVAPLERQHNQATTEFRKRAAKVAEIEAKLDAAIADAESQQSEVERIAEKLGEALSLSPIPL